MSEETTNYGADQIQILEGLEAVIPLTKQSRVIAVGLM